MKDYSEYVEGEFLDDLYNSDLNFKTQKKMSYGNYNNNFSYAGYSRGGFSPAPFRQGYYPKRSNYSRSNYNGKRRSSCKTITKNGVTYVTGWKIGRKAGFRTFFVSPAKNQKNIYSKKDGSKTPWLTAKCEVVNKTHGTKSLFPALIHEKSLKVFILSLNIMINPNTGFISYIPKKR